MKTVHKGDSRILGRSLQQSPSREGAAAQGWQLGGVPPAQDNFLLIHCLASALVPPLLPRRKGLSVLSLCAAGLKKSLEMKHALRDTTSATQVFFEHCSQSTAALLLSSTSQTLKLPSLHCSLFCSFSLLHHPVPLIPQTPLSTSVPS